MQGWAAGIVCLYVALGVFNWVTGLHMLAQFSLPLSIVGGLGLAIASTPSPAQRPTPTPERSENTAPPSDTAPDTAPTAEVSRTPTAAPPKKSSEPSISFTIDKNVRP